MAISIMSMAPTSPASAKWARPCWIRFGCKVGRQSGEVPLGAAPQLAPQLFKQRHLSRVDANSRLIQVEEFGPVHLRECGHTPRVRRPFHRERIALDLAGIAVAGKRPRVDDLAALLGNRGQFDECPLWFEAEFLLKFPLCRLQPVFARVYFPLRDGPDAGILPLPQRPARMHEQELQFVVLDPIHDQSCAFLRHSGNLHGPGATRQSPPASPVTTPARRLSAGTQSSSTLLLG